MVFIFHVSERKIHVFFASSFRYLNFYETELANVSKLNSLLVYTTKKVKNWTGLDFSRAGLYKIICSALPILVHLNFSRVPVYTHTVLSYCLAIWFLS